VIKKVARELIAVKQILPLKTVSRTGRLFLSTRWALRGLALLVLFLVLLCASGVYLIKTMFTPEHLTMLVAAQLQQVLGRPVVVENVRIMILQGIKIDRIRVLGETGDLLTAGPISVNYRWLPLFDKELKIRSVEISNTEINAVKDSSGTWNFADIQERFKSGGGEKVPVIGFLNKMDSARIEIYNASLSVRDVRAASAKRYSVENFTMPEFNTRGSNVFELSFNYAHDIGKGTVRASIYSEGAVDLAGLKLEEAELTDTDIQLRVLKKPVRIKLNLKNFIDPKFHVDMTVPAFSDADLYTIVNRSLGINIPQTSWSADLALLGRHLDVSNLRVQGGGILLKAGGSVDVSTGTASPSYNFTVRTNSFDLGNLEKYWSGFRIYFLDGQGFFSGEVAGRDGKPYLSKLDCTVKNATGIFWRFILSKTSLQLSWDNNLQSGTLGVTNSTVKVYDSVFSGIKAKASYAGGKLSVDSLSGLYNGDNFNLKSSISNLLDDKKRDVYLLARLHTLKIPALFSTVRDFAKAVSTFSVVAAEPPAQPVHPLQWLRDFRGKVPGFMPRFHGSLYADELVTPVISGKNFYAEFDLKNMASGMNKVSGKIDARLENGVVYQLERMAEQNKALNVAFRPFLAMHRMETSGAFQIGSVLRDVDFKTMALSTNWNAGAMWMNTCYFDGTTVSAHLNGSVDWPGEKLDMNIYTRFNSRAGMGGLSENLSDSSGHPALSFTISGPMQTPKTIMRIPDDVGKRIETAVKKGIRTSFKEIREFLKK